MRTDIALPAEVDAVALDEVNIRQTRVSEPYRFKNSTPTDVLDGQRVTIHPGWLESSFDIFWAWNNIMVETADEWLVKESLRKIKADMGQLEKQLLEKLRCPTDLQSMPLQSYIP